MIFTIGKIKISSEDMHPYSFELRTVTDQKLSKGWNVNEEVAMMFTGFNPKIETLNLTYNSYNKIETIDDLFEYSNKCIFEVKYHYAGLQKWWLMKKIVNVPSIVLTDNNQMIATKEDLILLGMML